MIFVLNMGLDLSIEPSKSRKKVIKINPGTSAMRNQTLIIDCILEIPFNLKEKGKA